MATRVDDALSRLLTEWMAAHPGHSNEDLQEARQNLIPQAQAEGNAGRTQKEIADQQTTPDFDNDGNVITGKTYLSPGAAEVGGYAGGAKDISSLFKESSKGNDAAQALNSAALGDSVRNMSERRGDMSPENAALVAREADARVQQGQALDIQRDAALGNAPSAAAYQTQSDMNNIAGGQAGAMGSARGLAAMGGVQGAGASGVGQAGTEAAAMGGMGRSREMSSALGMYGSSAGNMRQGDLGRLSQTSENALGNMRANDAWQVGNANLGVKQGNLGVQMGNMDDAYNNASNEPLLRQHGYNQEMNAIKSGANADAAAATRAKFKARQDANRDLAKNSAVAGLTIVGGPVAGGIGNSAINTR